MLVRSIILFLLSVIFYSCFSLSIDKHIEVNIGEDWLYIGGDSAKTNISRSKSVIDPPFKLYWQFDTDGGLGKNCLSVSDAIMFANTLNGEFYAIDVVSGKSLGRTSTTGKASFSTPLIYKNNIIITSSGDKNSRIFSYSLITGLTKWQRNIGWVESSPILNDENIIVSSLNGKLYKLNVNTGNIVWTTKKVMFNNYIGSFYTSPTIMNNMILAGNADGHLYSYDIITGNEVWKYKTNASVNCDASVKDGRIYFGSDDKNFYCLDTAGSLIWKKDLHTKILSSSTFYRDMIIVTGIDGNVYALNKESGDVVWTFITKGSIEASPLLHGDMIFVGSFDRNFYCINAADGKELWRYQCEGRVKTSAVIWKDYIFVASDDRDLYCFSNKELPKTSSGESIK
ncbi:MAG: PQQ-binding-like beta-propeller repeat protein [Bacteroidota bacterium]|nr:PQQ-binding-like beta-propeller repeat protein [Bacteroidota bacterium]